MQKPGGKSEKVSRARAREGLVVNPELDEFVGYLKALKRAPATIDGYRRELRRFLAWLDAQAVQDTRAVTRAHIERYSAQLVQGGRYKPQTLHLMLRAVSRFYEYLERIGRILVNPADGIPRPKLGNRLPRAVLTSSEVKRLLNAPDTSTRLGIRNRAILEVLYSSGIRVGELCALTVYDVDTSAGFLRIRHGIKGTKDRLVPIGHTATRYMKEYLRKVRGEFTRRYRESRQLFVGQRGGLGVMSIQTLVKRYAAEAGIKKRVTPHSLRHAFATHMVVAGADIVHVQRMLGHADIGTTQIYTRIAPIDAQREHQRTHPAEQQQVPKDFMPVRKLKPDYVRRKRKGKAK